MPPNALIRVIPQAIIETVVISDSNAELIADESQPVRQRLDALRQGQHRHVPAQRPVLQQDRFIGSRRGL